jgi:gentisate 1,2-dioxygenase
MSGESLCSSSPDHRGPGYTVVNRERVQMFPGGLVLTPNWTWHDHANDTDASMMIWLDDLDTPLVRMLEASSATSTTRSGRTSVRAATRRCGTTRCRRCGPPCAAPRCRRFRRCRRRDYHPIYQPAYWRTGDADHRLLHESTAPRCEDAGASPCSLHELSRSRRVWRLHGGAGQWLDWEDRNVFTVPISTFHEHVNSGDRPAFLFSFSDAPVTKALSLYPRRRGHSRGSARPECRMPCRSMA